MAKPESRNSIQVIERMTRLLEVLARHTQPVALKVLAQASNLHPSTAHRILGALVNDRLVERADPGSYRLGIRLLELGNLVKVRISVREHALPYMRELHAATGEAVNLSVRRDDEIVYVERTSSGRSLMQVVNIVGTRAPLHITAAGKLFLLDRPSRLRPEDASAAIYAQHAHHGRRPRARARAHPPQRLRTGQRGGGARRALHRCGRSQRRGSSGRRPVGVGPCRAHEDCLVGTGQGNRRENLASDWAPRVDP